jgi:signal transduction histidine kinase
MSFFRGLAARIAVAALAASTLAVGIVAVGVLTVGEASFASLMMAGEMTLDMVPVIRSAVELAALGFQRARIRVDLDLPPSLPAVAVPDHLSQVLANLLQNAQRYTPAGGSVALSAWRDGGSLLVSVANTGPEIPQGQLARVFERFYRVDRSRDRATGGAGIGLAIVKQLVEQAGGRVGAESSDGTTRFWFTLPA